MQRQDAELAQMAQVAQIAVPAPQLIAVPVPPQPVVAQPVVMAQDAPRFDGITGQPIPKFDPQTGKQNWGFGDFM